MTVFKSLLYLFLEAGLFALYIPLAVLRTGPKMETGMFSFLAIPVWLLGDRFTVFLGFYNLGRRYPITCRSAKGTGHHGILSLRSESNLCRRSIDILRALPLVWILGTIDVCNHILHGSPRFCCFVRGANSEKEIRTLIRRLCKTRPALDSEAA